MTQAQTEKSTEPASKTSAPDQPKVLQPVKGLGIVLVSNSAWNLAAYVITMIIGIVSVPLYIHFLGVQHYGLMVLLNSILVPMGLLNLGFGQATIKYVAESIGRGDEAQANNYVRTTLLFNCGVGILGTFLIALLASFLSAQVFKIDPGDQQLAETAFYWIALGWLVNQISMTYAGIPTALQRYNLVAIGTSLSLSGGILVGLLALILGGDLLTLIQARFGWSLILIIFWAWLAKKLLPDVSLLPGWHREAFRRSANFGIWQTMANFGGLLANQTDKFILGIYLSTMAVGLYNIALTVQQTLYTVVYKLGEVLFPAISNLQGSGEDSRAKQLMLRSGWFLGILTIIILGPLIVFSHDVLRLYVGADIANSVSLLLQILLIAGVLSSGSVSVGQYVQGTGHTKWMAIMAFSSGLIILLGGLLLIPKFGLLGAGWSQILAIVLSRPVIHLFLWRSFMRAAVSAKVFFTYLYAPAVIGIIMALLLTFGRMQISWQPGWLELGAGIIMCDLILLAAVMGVDFLLPAGRQRHADMRLLINLLLAQSQTVLKRTKVLA